MFKIGDIVEITEETDATGILDFKKGEGYRVLATGLIGQHVKLENEEGHTDWYHCIHFKLKEDTKVEKKECLFKEGQVVWDLRSGRGVVEEITNDERYPVKVRFDLKDIDGDEIIDHYTVDGRYASTQTVRSLYFSEPKIEAATEPLFEPTLKEGDIVVYRNTYFNYYGVGEVGEEDEDSVSLVGDDSAMRKSAFDFYRLGEKINFK